MVTTTPCAPLVAAGCIVLITMTSACGDDPPTTLDLDVVVSSDDVRVYMAEVGRPCECSNPWLQPGECGGTTFHLACSCDPAPGSCVSSMRLERNGVLIASTDSASDGTGAFVLSAPSTPGLSLVIEGCGRSASIDLPADALIEPALVDAVTDGSKLELTYSGDPEVTSTIAGVGDGFGGRECHTTGADLATIPMAEWPAGTAGTQVWLGSVAGGDEEATPLGAARVWQHARTSFWHLFMPRRQADGRFTLPTRRDGAFWNLSLDGTTYDALEPDVALVDLTSDEPLLEVVGATRFDSAVGQIEYRAGDETDVINIQLEGDWYEAELPHVALGRDFELGLDGLEYEIVIGPVELARSDDATITRRETIHLAFLFGPSARAWGQAAP